MSHIQNIHLIFNIQIPFGPEVKLDMAEQETEEMFSFRNEFMASDHSFLLTAAAH